MIPTRRSPWPSEHAPPWLRLQFRKLARPTDRLLRSGGTATPQLTTFGAARPRACSRVRHTRLHFTPMSSPKDAADLGSFEVQKTRISFIGELRSFSVKYIASGLLVLGLLAVQVSEANAAACAAGPYRAGCVGPRGAVGVHRGYGYRGGYGYHGYGRHCYRGAYGRVVCR